MTITELIKKLWVRRWWLRSLPQTIWFNFHYLPFKQAIKLPIMLYKPTFVSLGGVISIDSDQIKTGMISLGKNCVSLYPNSGIRIDFHKEAHITFKGSCTIGNNSALSVGKTGDLVFGKDFYASTTLRIACYNRVQFGDYNMCGWDCLFMDTDFHSMTKLTGGHSKGFGPIIIGDYNWFATRCQVLKNTTTPNYSTFSAGNIIVGNVDAPEYSVLGRDNSLLIKSSGVYRNPQDDIINYQK